MWSLLCVPCLLHPLGSRTGCSTKTSNNHNTARVSLFLNCKRFEHPLSGVSLSQHLPYGLLSNEGKRRAGCHFPGPGCPLPTWQRGCEGGPELTAKGTLQSGGILCFNNFGEIINIKTKTQHSTWNTGEHSEPHSACCTPVQLSSDVWSLQPSPV